MRMIGLAARLAIVGLVIGVAILSTTSPFGPGGLLLSLPYLAMGAVLVIRRPRNSISWILIGVALCFALISVPTRGTPQEFADGSVDLPVALFAVIHAGLPTTLFLCFAVLVMVFPSGRLPVGRWGRLGRAGLGVALVFAAAAYVVPEINAGNPVSAVVRNPAALLPDLAIWGVINSITVGFPGLILVIAGSVSLVVRVRRAAGTERQQLRWIAASFAFLMSSVVSGYVMSYLVPGSGESGLAWIAPIVAFPTVPIAIGIAVLRYRLFEIDRIISRTIGWAVVTGILGAIFVATIVGLQAILVDVTQAQTLSVAASTLVAFVLFQPLRRRVQSVVDHRFNRARYDAERTAAAFAERQRDQVNIAGLKVDIAGTIDSALSPRTVGIWIRPSGPGGMP
jgi:hypothetical protein